MVEVKENPVDMKQIIHPDHYAMGRKYEAWDVAKDWELDFDLGSVVKYISRCGRKAGENKVKDLYKCIQYLNHAIDYELSAIEED